MNRYFYRSNGATDEELLIRLQGNDEGAFAMIYERYHKGLYVIAYKYLKDQELTKDAVQHIFLKLWEYRSLQNINISLKNYLFTMLKNHVLNEIRNNLTAMEKNYEISQMSEEADNEFVLAIEKQDLIQQLHKAIEYLPEQKKKVCIYKLKDNLSNKDIADKMHISIPTVKTHYSQAIQFLKAYFRKTMLLVLSFFYLF
ncbi:MAG: RNA polymerase sigma-70 factor [Tannerellaceae bacterium]|jgi:RNA polymerase sigma-70 factor (ECF subfamily)|nr:RNA polymerase sigma-70 factor [Tannerellaceae bacterium]